MGLPRTFVGFSSTDIDYFRMMLAWKAHEHIDFNFTNVQLPSALNSSNEDYIKRRCREQIAMAGTYVLLIGQDTWQKTTFVQWEVEVAIEKECRLIAANIDKWRTLNPATCPSFIARADALFVPFSPQVIAYALDVAHWQRPTPPTQSSYYIYDHVYTSLGYVLSGDIAFRLSKPNPYR